MWCTMRLALVGCTAMCFASGAKESGRSHRSFDQGHADEATVQVIDPKDMEATANDVKELQVGAAMVELGEMHSASSPRSHFSDKPSFLTSPGCTHFCFSNECINANAVACQRCCNSVGEQVSCWYSCDPLPYTLPPEPTPMPRTAGFQPLWLLMFAASCCLVPFLAFRSYLNPRRLDVPSAVQQQTSREVPLRHAEQWLQTESSPQVDPRQAFHFQVQLRPLAPSAPHAPVATVEDHHAAASSSNPCCVICMAAPAEFACVPCGHMCGCQLCLSEVRQCPICRQDFEQTVKVFASVV